MDIFSYYNSEDNSMIKACIQNDFNLCKIIFNKKPEMIIKKNINLRTPFSTCCAIGNLEISQWIYKNSESKYLNEKDKQGHYPLYLACREGHIDIIKWLYEIGFRDMIQPDLLGQKPIWFLCNHSYIDIKKREDILLFLIEKGIKIDNENNSEDYIYNGLYKYLRETELKYNLIESVKKKILQLQINKNQICFKIIIMIRNLNLFFDSLIVEHISEFIIDIVNIKNLLLFNNSIQNI